MSSQETQQVQSMYEHYPYPDLGADLKSMDHYWGAIPDFVKDEKPRRYLEVGCGTGHYLVGTAKRFKNWSCHGIDLSSASLAVCSGLIDKHNVSNVVIERGDYSQDLPFEGAFDVICALGTIHHCADPLAAMKNLKKYLADDGMFFLHLYGQRLDQGKFDIKEMLSIFEPDLSKVERRFGFYDGLMKHKRRRWLQTLLQTPLIDLILGPKRYLRNMIRQKKGVSWSPGWTAKYDRISAPWVDHFCHPCERAYEVPEVMDLVEQSGFEVYKMLGQGREHPQLIPHEWRDAYSQLSQRDKFRLSELLSYGGGSFNMILKKA